MTNTIRAALACAVAAAVAGCPGSAGKKQEPQTDGPALAVAPASLTFTTIAGAAPAAQTISVSNAGGGTLGAAVATVQWPGGAGQLGATVSGSGNAQELRVDVTAPALGTFTGAISIAADGAAGSPVTVPVTLVVQPAPVDFATPGGAAKAVRDAVVARYAACFRMAGWVQAIMASGRDEVAAGLDAAVAAGRVTYSRAMANACVAALGAWSCGEIEAAAQPAPCWGVFTGQVPNGGACGDDVECGNGYCALGSACPGTCTAFKAAGAACSDELECGPASLCDASGRCATRRAGGGDGEACTNGPLPTCKPGFRCDRATTTCKPELAAGAACDLTFPNQCAAGLSCVRDGAGHPRCVALAGTGEGCATATCGSGYFCPASTKTCVLYPTAGQSCAETQACSDGSYCLGRTAPVCTAGTVALGGTCKDYGGDLGAASASTLCQGGEQAATCAPASAGGTSWTCQQVRATCF